jgi:hypothetical protein
MRFDLVPFGLVPVAAAALTVAGCSSGARVPHHVGGSGPEPVSVNGNALWTGAAQNQVVTVERRGHSLEHFTVDPFTHVRALDLPLAADRELALPSIDAQYYVTASADDYGFIKADGSGSTVDPAPLDGTLQWVAYSPTAHFAVFADDAQELALVLLSSAGDVQASWRATNELPNNQYILAATMLADGQLVLTLSGTSVALVDIAASVTAQAWKATTFDVTGATDMNWVAQVPGPTNDTVMIIDGTRVLTVDLVKQAIVAQKVVGSATLLGAFRDATPHLVTQTLAEVTPGTNDVTYAAADGTLKAATVTASTSQLTRSWVDLTAGSVALAYDPDLDQSTGFNPRSDFYGRRNISRFKLADQSALDSVAIDSYVSLTLTSAYAIAVYPSPLGKAERYTYGATPAVDTLTDYDYGFIKGNYQ